jgi:hypothetical protein
LRQFSPAKRSGLSGASPDQFEDEDDDEYESDPGSPTTTPATGISRSGLLLVGVLYPEPSLRL